MNVWISVHGRFHAFDLARELARSGALGGIATTYPSRVVRRIVGPGPMVKSAPWIEAARRLAARTPWAGTFDPAIVAMFGRYAAVQVPAFADVFVGWSSASLEAFPVARRRGARLVLERGSTHIEHQASVLSEEYRAFGLTRAPVDARIIERECREYEEADRIVVPSHYAAETFRRRGVPAGRVIVNPYGADLTRFYLLSRTLERKKARILLVGAVSLRKGAPWMLRAFASLAPIAELHFVGPIESGLRDILRREAGEGVTFCGPLRGEALEKAYADADIFCLPSLEEGLPLSLLQAMAAGLPVVATPETGAGDVITDGKEGLLVLSRRPEELKGALLRLIQDRHMRLSMGSAARHAALTRNSWEAYGQRSLTLYNQLCAGDSPAAAR